MSITTDKGPKKRRLEETRISAAKDRPTETERKSAELKKRKKEKRLKRERDAGLETHERSEENVVVSGGTSTREGSEGEATQQDEDGGETREERKRRKKQRKEEKRRQRKDSTQQNPSNEHNGIALKSGRSYEQHPDLTAISQAEIDTFLASNSISTVDAGAETYRPITKFSQISPSSKEVEIFNEFASPTPVQAATWPYLLAGRDVIGVAETGSGKTLAYGVPLVRHVGSKQMKAKIGIKALVVAPTRELAVQIHEQLEQLVAGTRLRTVCVYGGIPKDHQRPALNISNIVVATPGRLNDFIQEGAADLSEVGLVVLDEADRMLEKGFEEEMRKILGTITTPGRQTAMFTATWPQSIRDLAATFMRNPVRVNIGDAGGDLRANTRVAQRVEVMDPRNKENRLLQLLKQYHTGKSKDDRILVFCLYKKEASRVEQYVRSRGFAVGGIHGDMNQIARMESLDGFRSGKVPLLVATDVAARGLDIPAVKLVINLTFPLTVEDYVHRIGRTGRAGKDGLAITLFTEHEKALSGSLINVLRAAKQPVPDDLLKFGTTVKKKTHEAYGAFYKDMGDAPQKSTKITFD